MWLILVAIILYVTVFLFQIHKDKSRQQCSSTNNDQKPTEGCEPTISPALPDNKGWHPKEEAHKTAEHQYWNDQIRYTKRSFRFSALTFFVAVVAACVAGAAWYQTKRQADTAETQVSIARDTAKRQLRAYVTVNKGQIDDFGIQKPVRRTVELKNTGMTPSYRTRTYLQITAGPFPRNDFPQIKVGKNESILGPGTEIDLTVALPKPLTETQLSAIKDGSGAIYVFGAIAYIDAFDVLRCTHFRFFFSGWLTSIDEPAPRMANTEDGNSADDKCEELLSK